MNLIWQKERILFSSLSCKMARKDLRLFTLLFSQSYLPFQVVWPIEGSLYVHYYCHELKDVFSYDAVL